jgi:hypothetical protein
MRFLRGITPRLRHYYRWYGYVPLNAMLGRLPVIIYTVGKVGSTSIYESLPNSVFWVQVHTLNPQEWEKARQARLEQDVSIALAHAAQVRTHIVEAGRKAKYITVVREPLSRNISAFFEGFHHFTGRKPSSKPEDQPEQAKIFLEQYPHERILNFFDLEYKTMLGLDVFAQPFPHEQGYQTLTFERGDLLILRTESDDTLKEQAIKQYLDLPDFRLRRANVREEQGDAAAYRAFKQSLVLQESYIEQMLESQYCRHFYTPEERQALREQWLARL